MAFTLDAKRSAIRIRAFAEGLFSKLAHDLELQCRELSGVGSDERSCTITVPIGAIDVAGTLKNGRLDPSGLSPSDRKDLLGKMRREVFHGADAITVEANLDKVKVRSPNGKDVEVSVSIAPKKQEDGSLRALGVIQLSLSAIGSDPVKGPMNAFRMKDLVEVHFDVVFSEG